MKNQDRVQKVGNKKKAIPQGQTESQKLRKAAGQGTVIQGVSREDLIDVGDLIKQLSRFEESVAKAEGLLHIIGEAHAEAAMVYEFAPYDKAKANSLGYIAAESAESLGKAAVILCGSVHTLIRGGQ